MLIDSDIKRISQGDKDAFKLLHKMLYKRMFFFTYNLTKDADLTEDIIQETFILFWNNRTNFQEILAVKSYIYATLKNKALTVLRDDSNRKRILDGIKQEEAVDTDYLMVATEICGEVQQAVKRLPDQTRKVIELSMQDMTVEMIAKELEISPNTVKSLKKSGYRHLRESLGHLRSILIFL